MKTIYLTILALCAITFSAEAQNLNNTRIKVKYLRYPTDPLPEEVKTFSSNYYIEDLPANTDRSVIEDALKSSANIPGYNKVSVSESDLHIKVSHYNFLLTDVKRESQQKESKDKDGKVTKWTEYYYTFNYKRPMKLYVKNKVTDEVLFDDYVDFSQSTQKGTSTASKSSDNARTNYNNKVKSLKASTRESALKAVSSYLARTYGFTETYNWEDLKSVKKFKKYEYPEIDEAVATMKTALESLEPTEDYITEEFKASINEAREILESQLALADFTNKKAKINEKIASAMYNNIALGYYWLNDFDSAYEILEKSKDLKSNGWTKVMKSSLDNKKSRYEANGLIQL